MGDFFKICPSVDSRVVHLVLESWQLAVHVLLRFVRLPRPLLAGGAFERRCASAAGGACEWRCACAGARPKIERWLVDRVRGPVWKQGGTCEKSASKSASALYCGLSSLCFHLRRSTACDQTLGKNFPDRLAEPNLGLSTLWDDSLRTIHNHLRTRHRELPP